jgi:hypothetical protein
LTVSFGHLFGDGPFFDRFLPGYGGLFAQFLWRWFGNRGGNGHAGIGPVADGLVDGRGFCAFRLTLFGGSWHRSFNFLKLRLQARSSKTAQGS